MRYGLGELVLVAVVALAAGWATATAAATWLHERQQQRQLCESWQRAAAGWERVWEMEQRIDNMTRGLHAKVVTTPEQTRVRWDTAEARAGRWCER